MLHRRTLTGMILCHNCKKQECQDIILQFNSVICSINTISVSVAVLQMRIPFSHNNNHEYHFTYLFQEL